MKTRSKTQFAVLGLLSWQPMSGYDIKKMITMGLSHFWAESYGQLYPTLEKLVKEGLATKSSESTGKRKRHVFSITDPGRHICHFSDISTTRLVGRRVMLDAFRSGGADGTPL